ncbi:OTU-like cysteine protease [Musa troglodytarum]|uniref:ubiquitinyl hydrolase 1 n=2 Tax=Musa troglodytarum TaxID=320322 RepID=A0A9E7H7V7_9LILI|nr:OTU-like cysteine protease [Musa troglodytarum]
MSGQPDYVRESSSSSRSSNIQETEDDMTIGSILAEANHHNGRNLGKRLSHLDSIPHTPRVNGQIPDVDNATLDHERLSERLAMYGLAELQVEGDGNCQFRAVADQLFHNPEYHRHVRKAVVKQLKQFKNYYESYVPMEYKTYLKNMKRSGEWGDHLTLQAAADRFGAKICLLTSFRDTCFIEINPKEQSPTRGMPFVACMHLSLTLMDRCIPELWLSFWSEVHYNSLYEADDLPTRVPKRKHWLF